MSWIYYLLEANLYLAAFYGFYRLFLHRETFYTLNRYYLLCTAVIAFILPLFQVSYLYNLIGLSRQMPFNENLGTMITQKQEINMDMLITYAYIGIAVVFLSRLIINLFHILICAFRNAKLRKDHVIYVELPGSETAFSFFNLLFINPNASEKITIIKHEMVHIHQKHSADILFFEVIQILNWFNPITYLLKKEVKLLHEYIADEDTTSIIQKHEYAMFLIQNSFGVLPNQLTNQIFNQSILKMRINMLNKEKSTGRARLKLLLLLPVVSGMLCTSTMAFTKDYNTVDLYPKKYNLASTINQDTLKKVKPTVKKSAKGHIAPPPPPVEPTPPTPPTPNLQLQAPQDKIKFPPPPPVEPTKKRIKAPQDQIKFPPPIVKPDKNSKSIKSQDQVKFPPPIVRPDKISKSSKSQDQIKFPPPIVKPDKKSKSRKSQGQIKYPPPIVKPDPIPATPPVQ